jgi:phage host-nuclease inhibitor protein Gam
MKITDEKTADEAGRKYLVNEAKVSKLEHTRDEAIRKAREKYKDQITETKKENKAILENMADWFWANSEKRDPKTKGQLSLTHVKLSERKTKEYKYPAPLSKVISKAKKLGLPFIRTKEEVAKDKIKAEATEDQLKALGIREVETSTVYIEPV